MLRILSSGGRPRGLMAQTLKVTVANESCSIPVQISYAVQANKSNSSHRPTSTLGNIVQKMNILAITAFISFNICSVNKVIPLLVLDSFSKREKDFRSYNSRQENLIPSAFNITQCLFVSNNPSQSNYSRI